MWEKVGLASVNAVPPRVICQQPAYQKCVQTADGNLATCEKEWDGSPQHSTVCSQTLSAALASCYSQLCRVPQPTQLTVKENLLPTEDAGRFSLSIDGKIQLTNVGDQADTGVINVSTGVHLVSEGGASNTDLANYVVQFQGDCVSTDTSHGPLTRPVSVAVGQQKSCTITNRGFPAVKLIFVAPSDDPGIFNVQIDHATVGTGGTANGMITRINSLPSATHQVSVVPANAATNMDNYSVTFGGDCQMSGLITLAAGDEKLCRIQVLRAGVGGCPAGQQSCGQAPGHPPLCVTQGVSCNALCTPGPRGQQGTFCDVKDNGLPWCVYPPASCQ